MRAMMLVRRIRGRVVAVTPESQSARYFASLYAAPSERPALDALFGIEREVFDSLRPGLDHHVAHTRLQWWREECERAARGGAAHPLIRTLITALGDSHAKSVPQLAGLCGIVDVATWDLANATFETRRELEAYCHRWAAAMIEPLVAVAMSGAKAPPTSTGRDLPAAPATPIASAAPATAGGSVKPTAPATWDLSGASNNPASAGATASDGAAGSADSLASAQRSAAWQELGAAICEIELLAGLARDATSGRIRLPLDELESANVDTNALAKQPWPETAAALIRSRLTSLRADIEHSVSGLSREYQQALRGLLVWASLSWRAAQRMEHALPDRLQPGRLDGISEAWYAWRIARRATVGRFELA
jgi:phytoene/squalene synthetase